MVNPKNRKKIRRAPNKPKRANRVAKRARPNVKHKPAAAHTKRTAKITKTGKSLHANGSHKTQTSNIKQKEKLETGRKRLNVNVPQPDEVKAALNSLLSNEGAVEYLKKNVSKMAVDVIGMLVTPKTDEYLAEQLGTKINAIRRILNIMQGYGITNYYISKNTKGWLSFAWYINTSKLPPFLEYIEGMEKEKSIVNDACNDYFICEGCYKADRFVFTFDSAFESNFKCNNCGKSLNRMNREEAKILINKESRS
jgi:transcription initiation factor IIE alpha subunit